MIRYADSSTNRAFRFGDGFFETIRTADGTAPMWPYHWKRILRSAEFLGMELPKDCRPDLLFEEVVQYKFSRVRITFYRVDDGLYEPAPRASTALWFDVAPYGNVGGNSPCPHLTRISVCPDIRLSCDPWSNIKSCSALRYVAAARYKAANDLEDCFLLNAHERVAEAGSSNVFVVTEDEAIVTPPLTEGCVAGVMRLAVLHLAEGLGYRFREAPLTLEDLGRAKEIFLTNAVRGLRSVERFGERTYETAVCTRLKSHSPI
jgi:branched-chain amino acid aminotransferase